MRSTSRSLLSDFPTFSITGTLGPAASAPKQKQDLARAAWRRPSPCSSPPRRRAIASSSAAAPLSGSQRLGCRGGLCYRSVASRVTATATASLGSAMPARPPPCPSSPPPTSGATGPSSSPPPPSEPVHQGGGEDAVGRGAERGAGEHPGRAGGVVRGAGHPRRARARRRLRVPAPRRRPAPAPRRRPPPRRPHHRRPPQGLPHRSSCDCAWHDGGLPALPDEVAGPGQLEDRRRSHGQLHRRSGELRGDLGGAGHVAVGGGGGRGGGQPHLGALLHGRLRAGVQDPSRAQDRGRRGRQREPAPGRHVRAARRRGAGAVLLDLQGRHGAGRVPRRRPGRHAAVRDGAGGAAGDGVPGHPGRAGAERRDHGADPDAGVLHGGGRQRERGGRGHQGARRVRVRGGAGGRAPRRGARGGEARGAGEEGAARRVERQRRRADHRGRHGHGERVELAHRARDSGGDLRDLCCHVPWHRVRHVRAPENFWILVSGGSVFLLFFGEPNLFLLCVW